ncbi:hypothetical protein ABPG75_004702 [Micractinium tetrahymenae]
MDAWGPRTPARPAWAEGPTSSGESAPLSTTTPLLQPRSRASSGTTEWRSPSADACAIDFEDCNGKGRKPPPSRRGPAGYAAVLRPLLMAALALALMAGSFTAGSRLGKRYAYVTAQLHIDSQLSQLHSLAKRRLAAITGDAHALQGGAYPWPVKSFAEAEQNRLVAQAAQQERKAGGVHFNGSETTLSFQVCNGFANQRAALISGIVLAAQLNRTVILPRLLLNGTQPDEAEVNEKTSGSIPFGDMFDVGIFTQRLAARGVRVSTQAPDPSQVLAVKVGSFHDLLFVLNTTYSSQQHLRLDCPMFRVHPDIVTNQSSLVFATMDAMQPNARFKGILQKIETKLRSMSNAKAYNVLHLRAEEDWLTHCKRWENIPDGVVRDNCMNNTETVGEQLQIHGVNQEVPLLLATSLVQADKRVLAAALKSLKEHNYTVVMRHELFVGAAALPALSREESALIDYYLGLNSHQFVGNSVSSFSAMIIMERWNAGRYASYYNAGNIPLEVFFPLYKMPWVFTYNDWSVGTEYELMVKAAVRSAIYVARMKPFCMYSGSTTSPIYSWFVDQGVTIITHTPSWKEAFSKEVERNRQKNTKEHSHLYATDGRMVGTFQRIDIPILREFDQYHYVLFTDCDVFFRQQMKLVDWGTPLPIAAGMGYEMDDMFPYNAGIMLMNIPYLRKTNADFISWILKQKNGLYFDGYGPLDQGAINQYYEKEIKGRPMSKDFNAKPYQEFRNGARIVHLHGPKPNHYLDWLLTGKCDFGGICEGGFFNAVCKYMTDYALFATEWDVAATLRMMCTEGHDLVEARTQWAAMQHQH